MQRDRYAVDGRQAAEMARDVFCEEQCFNHISAAFPLPLPPPHAGEGWGGGGDEDESLSCQACWYRRVRCLRSRSTRALRASRDSPVRRVGTERSARSKHPSPVASASSARKKLLASRQTQRRRPSHRITF